MTPLQAVVLALVQAATEFLPVSSSGHLILLPRLLGWSDQGLEFDIATNTGTLLAIVAYFRADLARLARGLAATLGCGRAPAAHAGPAPDRDRAADARLAGTLLLATVPAGLAGILVEEWVATVARGWEVVAANAAVYGALLLAADRFGAKRRALGELSLRDGLLVGCAQALALVPGTSRSGVTMSAALALGYTRAAAARFSFLLAVPIGAAVAADQLLDLARGVPLGVPAGALALGIAVSALAGYAVIAFLLAWVRRRSLAAFAVYRLLLAGFLALYFSGA